MIKIENNFSILDIIKAIEETQEKEIILNFPIGNSILHSYVSLKILKNVAGFKPIIIITHDWQARHIGAKLGIQYSILRNIKHKKNNNIIQYNYTFFEYFCFLIKSNIQNIFGGKSTHEHISNQYKKILNHKYIKNDPTKLGIFISGMIVSTFMFIFIFYFAVNKTYITITPEVSIKTRAKNLVFKEIANEDQQNIKANEVKLIPISKLVYLEQTSQSSGIYEPEKYTAKGTITIYNELMKSITLKKNTRVMTEDGILYVLQEKTKIPPAKLKTNGSLEKGSITIDVEGKVHDKDGNIAGEKANIQKGSILIIPGLGKNYQVKIYAEALTDFHGGKNNYQKAVTKEDIENAKKILTDKLKAKALGEIKNEISNKNKSNNIRYEILGIDNIITFEDLKISGEDNIVIGNAQEKFRLAGTIKVSTYIYNKDSVIHKLKTSILENLLENIENVQFINDDSLRLANIIYRKTKPLEIKISSEIEVFYSHNFLGENNNYISKLTNTIAGMNKKYARDVLINSDKISDVYIDIRPFFVKNITKIPKNIVFKVKEKTY